MRLHIHFGIHRTGTTTAQELMYLNKDVLLSHGILYPDLGVGHKHTKVAWQLKSKKLSAKQLVKKIHQEVTPLTEKIILSSEDFCQTDIEALLNALSASFNITASVYLRRQDVWLDSWYNQHVKWPWMKKFSGCTPEFFLQSIDDFFWLDYKDLVQKMMRALPKEKILLGVVEKGAIENTAADFFEKVGINPLWMKPLGDKNASLSTARLEILRRVDIFDLNTQGRIRVLSTLRSIDVEEDDGSKVVFGNEQANRAISMFDDTNKFVAREFLGREKLFLSNAIGRDPVRLSDSKVFGYYIPELLKKLANT